MNTRSGKKQVMNVFWVQNDQLHRASSTKMEGGTNVAFTKRCGIEFRVPGDKPSRQNLQYKN